MDFKTLIALFLTVTFAVHGIAFTVLGLKRRKAYYFFLTGTFTFLTALYLVKFGGWSPKIPGTDLSVTLLLRLGATLCTLGYLGVIYREKGTWLWKLTRGKATRDS
jgi:hypothetical protein